MPESAYDRQLRRAWQGDYSADKTWAPPSVEPAATDPAEERVAPAEGRLVWLLDAAAASGIGAPR